MIRSLSPTNATPDLPRAVALPRDLPGGVVGGVVG